MKTALSSAFLAALLAAGAAQARPDESGADTASIRSGDLDLDAPGGLETFHGRVRAAANRICGLAPGLPFYEARSIGDCRAEISRSADRQVSLAMAEGGIGAAGTR